MRKRRRIRRVRKEEENEDEKEDEKEEVKVEAGLNEKMRKKMWSNKITKKETQYLRSICLLCVHTYVPSVAYNVNNTISSELLSPLSG